MMMGISEAVAAKLTGAFSGAFLALIFMVPKSRFDFFRRLIFSIIAGVVFAPVSQHYIALGDTWVDLAAHAGIAALASWWIVGGFVRLSQTWKK